MRTVDRLSGHFQWKGDVSIAMLAIAFGLAVNGFHLHILIPSVSFVAESVLDFNLGITVLLRPPEPEIRRKALSPGEQISRTLLTLGRCPNLKGRPLTLGSSQI